MELKKVVLKLDIHDDKDKRKALKAVSSLEGIDSISVDMNGSKMTVIGDVDPVRVIIKLKKPWRAEIVTVGPAKEEKKEEKKGGNTENKKGGKEEPKLVLVPHHHFPAYPPYTCSYVVDENPNTCSIS